MSGDPWQLPATPPTRLPNTLRERLFHIIDAASFQASSYSASAANAVLAAGWRGPPEVVRTVAELDALVPLTVIVTSDGKAWQAGVLDGYDIDHDVLTYTRIWRPVGDDNWSGSANPTLLPALVVWLP